MQLVAELHCATRLPSVPGAMCWGLAMMLASCMVLLVLTMPRVLLALPQNSMYGWSEFLREMKGFYQVGP